MKKIARWAEILLTIVLGIIVYLLLEMISAFTGMDQLRIIQIFTLILLGPMLIYAIYLIVKVKKTQKRRELAELQVEQSAMNVDRVAEEHNLVLDKRLQTLIEQSKKAQRNVSIK